MFTSRLHVAGSALVLGVATLALAGCGGGGSGAPASPAPASAAGGSVAPQAPAPATSAAFAVATWGQHFTWDDGVAIQVAAPAATPYSGNVNGNTRDRIIKVAMTVTNNSPQPYALNPAAMGPQATFAGSAPGEVIDGGAPGNYSPVTVLPGKAYTYFALLSVDPAKGDLQLEYMETPGSHVAIFDGLA